MSAIDIPASTLDPHLAMPGISWPRAVGLGILVCVSYFLVLNNPTASLTYTVDDYHDSENEVANRQKKVTSSSALGYIGLATIGFASAILLPARFRGFRGVLAFLCAYLRLPKHHRT